MRPVSQIATDTLQAGDNIYHIGDTLELLPAETEALTELHLAYLAFRDAQADIYRKIHLMQHEFDPELQEDYFNHREMTRRFQNANDEVMTMIMRRLDAPIPLHFDLMQDPPVVKIRQPLPQDALVVNKGVIASATGFNKHIGEARALAFSMLQDPNIESIELDYLDWLNTRTPYLVFRPASGFFVQQTANLNEDFDTYMEGALNGLLNNGQVIDMLRRTDSAGKPVYQFPSAAIVMGAHNSRIINIDGLFDPGRFRGTNRFEQALDSLVQHVTATNATQLLIVRATQLTNPQNPEESVPGFLVTVVTVHGVNYSVAARGYQIESREDGTGNASFVYRYQSNGTAVSDDLFTGILRRGRRERAAQTQVEADTQAVVAE